MPVLWPVVDMFTFLVRVVVVIALSCMHSSASASRKSRGCRIIEIRSPNRNRIIRNRGRVGALLRFFTLHGTVWY